MPCDSRIPKLGAQLMHEMKLTQGHKHSGPHAHEHRQQSYNEKKEEASGEKSLRQKCKGDWDF